MQDLVIIYYKDKQAEASKIDKITALAEVKNDIHITEASNSLLNIGFELPVVSIGSKLYGYSEAVDILEKANKKN